MSTVKTDSLQPTIAGNNLILKTGSGDVERVRIAPTGAMTVSSTVASTFGGSLTVNGVSTLKGKLGLGAAYSGTPVPDLDIVTSNNSSVLDPQLNTPSTTQSRAAAAFGHVSTGTKLFIGNSSSDVVWMQLQNTSSPSFRATLSLQSMGGGVAIGATRAAAPLHVFGGPRYGSYAEIRLTDEYVPNASFGILAQTGATTKAFRILDWRNSVDYIDRLWIDSNGHVGIGATSGINPLTYLNSTGSTPYSSVLSVIGRSEDLDEADGRIELNNPITPASITTSTTFGRIYFVAGAQSGANKIKALIDCLSSANDSNKGGNIRFFTNPGGSATAAIKNHVTINEIGTLTCQADSSPAFVVNSKVAGTANTSAVVWQRNGTQCGYIQFAGSSVSFQNTSDYRLKTDVSSLSGGLDVVSRLNPVSFKWKNGNTDDIGFIAHELQQVVPLATDGIKDAVKENGDIIPQTICMDKLVPVLTAAIKELKAIVDAQAVEIAQLKAQ